MNQEKRASSRYEELLGEGFDNCLKNLGLILQPQETSWEFRKRAFPVIWKRISKNLAMAFLLLLRRKSWSETDMSSHLSLDATKPSEKDLERFARGFSADPIVSRGYGAETDWIMRGVVINAEPKRKRALPEIEENAKEAVGDEESKEDQALEEAPTSPREDVPSRELLERFVVEAAAKEFGVTTEKILSRAKTSKVVLARQVAMYLLRETRVPFPRIGYVFGRDHTTAVHACQRINEKEKSDNELARSLENIRAELSIVRGN